MNDIADTRPSWDEYFLTAAENASMRSTCPRLHVGCVFVRDKYPIMQGYNGALSGHQHCTAIGCILVNNHCIRSLHAENNAIIQAAKLGVSLDGTTLYVTHNPCWFCTNMVIGAGVKRIVFAQIYKMIDPMVIDLATFSGVIYQHLSEVSVV